MNKYLLITMISCSLLAFGCGGTETAKNAGPANDSADQGAAGTKDSSAKPASESAAVIATPTDAVKVFIEGIRAKDEAKMRSSLSKMTLERFDKMAADNKQSFFDVVVGEDLEEMSKMPEMRNEKIEGDKATLELKNEKTEEWDPVPFVREDGGWKIALFDSAPKEGQ